MEANIELRSAQVYLHWLPRFGKFVNMANSYSNAIKISRFVIQLARAKHRPTAAAQVIRSDQSLQINVSNPDWVILECDTYAGPATAKIRTCWDARLHVNFLDARLRTEFLQGSHLLLQTFRQDR